MRITDYDGSAFDTEEVEEEEFVPCPEHGDQKVLSYGVTQGSDPYHIDKLACGHWVICMGPGDPYTIIK